MKMADEKVKKDERKVVAFWVKIPPDLRNLFKSYCAKRGKTMTQMIIKLMKKTIEEAKV